MSSASVCRPIKINTPADNAARIPATQAAPSGLPFAKPMQQDASEQIYPHKWTRKEPKKSFFIDEKFHFGWKAQMRKPKTVTI
jgi:hypothetical protein